MLYTEAGLKALETESLIPEKWKGRFDFIQEIFAVRMKFSGRFQEWTRVIHLAAIGFNDPTGEIDVMS